MIVGVFYCLLVSTFCLFETFKRVLSTRVKGSFCRATLPFQSFSQERRRPAEGLSPSQAAVRWAPAGFSVLTPPPLLRCTHRTPTSLLSLVSQGWPVPHGTAGHFVTDSRGLRSKACMTYFTVLQIATCSTL